MTISRAILVSALLLAALCGGALAQEQPVDLHPPVPKARPKDFKDTKDTKDTKDAKDARADAAAPRAPLTAAEAVRRADAWLDATQLLSADFVQVGPDGHRSEGRLTVERPGRMRFEFAPPDRLEIVADGRSVAVRDQKMDTQDLYFIAQTPLKFLLADHIDLAKDTQVLRVDVADSAVTIVIEDRATLGGSAQIELVFDPATFALKQWTVDEAQGSQTVVSLFNLDLTTRPDERLFAIDEQHMIGQKR